MKPQATKTDLTISLLITSSPTSFLQSVHFEFNVFIEDQNIYKHTFFNKLCNFNTDVLGNIMVKMILHKLLQVGTAMTHIKQKILELSF